jgi:para-nitrobenzyl esterase
MNRRSFLSSAALATGILSGGAVNIITAAKSEDSGSGPVVETACGKIRGRQIDKVYAFRGVPYGASTEGSGRFMPPQKPRAWTGVIETVELGHRSPQAASGPEPPEVKSMDRQEPMSEDCLVLNVWSQSVKSGKRPVMVWLHGGGFATGSAGFTIYDGANLARRHDVVVVGVNHRLNSFGYIYLADLGNSKFAESSNVGHLDIIQALEWVRDNISRFGGDPGNVTIFGQSGGGGKVCTLLAMPQAKALFHRAIMESGSAIRSGNREAATRAAQALLTKLNLTPNQLDELQKMPFQQFFDTTRGVPGLAGGAVVDGRTLPHDPFDPTAPPESASVPLLMGSVETEDTFFQGTPLDDMDDAALHDRVKNALRSDDADADRVIGVYKKKFSTAPNIDIYLKLAADNTRRANAVTMAERKMTQGSAPAYVYYFAWRSPVRDGKLKSFHTLEIPFVFHNIDVATSMTGEGADRAALQERVSGAWAAFARTGNPSIKDAAWPAYKLDERPTMVFNVESKVVNDPHHEERLALAEVKVIPGGRGRAGA